jgi:hypothetical protein
VRLVRQGIAARPYLAVSLSEPGPNGSFRRLTTVRVDANTGKVAAVNHFHLGALTPEAVAGRVPEAVRRPAASAGRAATATPGLCWLVSRVTEVERPVPGTS